MPSKDKPNFRDLIYWACMLFAGGLSVGGSWFTLQAVEKTLTKVEAMALDNKTKITIIETVLKAKDILE